MFSYLTLEDWAPEAHPLRPIREIVNAALREMEVLDHVVSAIRHR